MKILLKIKALTEAGVAADDKAVLLLMILGTSGVTPVGTLRSTYATAILVDLAFRPY